MVLYEPTTSDTATATAEKKSSTLTLDWNAPTRAPDDTIVKGDKVTFSGGLTGPDGEAIVGATVYLYDEVAAARVPVTAVTDSTGKWSMVIEFASVGTHIHHAEWDGNDIYSATSSPSITFIVETRVPVLTLSMPASAVWSSTVTWFGTMVDPKVTTYGIADKSIYLDESLDGVTWTQVAGPALTDGTGAYSGSYTMPTTPGTYYYRSRFPGGSPGAEHEEAVSPTVVVQVTEEEVPAPACFIATAAYGSPLVQQLHVLRRFRERCLPAPIVKTYYRLSPPPARFIAKHPDVRRIVRTVLNLVVNILRRS